MESVPDKEVNSRYRFIGRIPVRNIWLLQLYASEFVRLPGAEKNSVEKNFDDIPDLVAEILVDAVEKRLCRQLSLGYLTRTATLNRVRGRIDVLTTERHHLFARGLVACRFDDLTVDTLRNRYTRASLESISRLVQKYELKLRCRRLVKTMRTMGVSGICPTNQQMSADRFGHHDANDRYMISAAKLAFDLTVPTEEPGENVFPLPDREEHWVRKLFERAVGGFYRIVLSSNEWQVGTRTKLHWQIEEQTLHIEKMLPQMETDIVLNSQLPSGRRIVIDTKFTSILNPGRFREETLDSKHLHQIYAYLRSQVGKGDSSADHAEGVLLHPSVGEQIDEAVMIQGHCIRFSTVDLTASHECMRTQLLRIVKPVKFIRTN